MTPLNKIFLIEDDLDDVEVCLSVLKNIDPSIDVRVANDGAQAIKKLNDCSEYTPDLILLDLNMPKLNGKEVLQKIKAIKSCCDIPVVVCSTTGNELEKKEVLRLGADKFIVKPSTTAKMKTVFELLIKEYLHR